MWNGNYSPFFNGNSLLCRLLCHPRQLFTFSLYRSKAAPWFIILVFFKSCCSDVPCCLNYAVFMIRTRDEIIH